MFENQVHSSDSSRPASACCSQAEALVIIEALPLCCIDPLDGAAFEDAAACAALVCEAKGFGAGLPARSATIMPCAQALSLVEGVGHVMF